MQRRSLTAAATVALFALLVVGLPLFAAPADADTGATATVGTASRNYLSNPDFEFVDGGGAPGWTAVGAWYFPTIRPYQGKRLAAIDAARSQAGDRLTSQSALLVHQGSTITISGMYKSDSGGVDLGVEYCDETGCHVAWSPVAAQSAAADWTPVSRTFAITEDLWKQGVRSVRVCAQTLKEGADLALDAMKLVCDECVDPRTFTKAPEIDAGVAPNLAPNPAFTLRGGSPVGWEALAEGCPAEQAPTVDATSAKPALRLNGAATPVCWRSKRVPVDLSLPMRLSAGLRTQGVGDGTLTMGLYLYDASGRAVVASAVTPPVGGDAGRKVWTVRTAPLYKMPVGGTAEIRFALANGGKGSAWADDVRLTPEPMTLTVNTSETGNVFCRAKDVSFFAIAPNNLDRVVRLTVHIKVVDFWGATVQYEKRQMAPAARAAVFFPVKPKLKRDGHYTLIIRMCEGTKELAASRTDFALVGEPDPAKCATPSPFGVTLASSDRATLDLACEAQCGWARCSFAWADLEPKPDTFDLVAAQQMVNGLRTRAMTALVVIQGSPSWLGTDEARAKSGGKDVAAWEAFCTKLAEALRCEGIAYQISPCVADNAPEKYAEMLKAAYRGLRKGDAKCKVVAGPPGADASAYEKLCALGAGECFDIASVTNAAGSAEACAKLQAAIKPGRPIWNLQDDTALCSDPSALSGPAAVTAELVRAQVGALAAGCERTGWTSLAPCYTRAISDYNPGAVLNLDGTVRPAWMAQRTLASLLVRAKFVKWLDLGAGVRGALFAEEGAQTAIFWATGDKTKFTLTVDGTEAEVWDMMGGHSDAGIAGAHADLEARADPQALVVRGSIAVAAR